MKSKKIIAAALAAAMMVTSIPLPPVQVSAEETVVQSVSENTAIYLNQETPVNAEDDSQDIPVSVLQVIAGDQYDTDIASNVLDNNPDTHWHTHWYGTNREKHYLDFVLSEDYIVSGLRYLPRSGGGNGTITRYQIQISDDGNSWETVAEDTWENNESWKVSKFDEYQTKYVRLVSLDSVSDSEYVFASAAEVRLVGRSPELKGEMSAISVKTAPKTLYSVGSTFDPIGLVLNLIYEDGQTRELVYSNEADITFDITDELTSENTAVVITYGKCTTTLPIKVLNVEIPEKVPEINADDDTRDVPFEKLTAITDSAWMPGDYYEGPASFVLDNDEQTHWHTNWETDEGKSETNRWIGLELSEVTKIDGIRFLPRANGVNGRPTEYRVEYRETKDGEWREIETGEWDKNNADWKRVNFEPVMAEAVRLVGVHTNSGEDNDIDMSAAELRVTVPSYDAPTDTLTAFAESVCPETGNEGPASNVLDGNQNTYWHTNWTTNEATDEAKRWIGLKLEKAAIIDGIRFLPRNSGIATYDQNGIPTTYRVEYREKETDEWQEIVTGTFTWEGTDVYTKWKRVSFNPVKAKEVRLVGVETWADNGETNSHMSAAELRVTKPIEYIVEKTLEAIQINEAPDTLYTVGDTFDPTGLKLICVYSDGSSELLEYSEDAGITFGMTDVFTEAGTKTVTITYQEKVAALDVVVQKVPVLTGIEVLKNPRINYTEGDTFNPTGLRVKRFYDNKAEDEVSYIGNKSAFTFDPNTELSVEHKSVKITYTVGAVSVTTDLSIEVKDKAVLVTYQTKKEDLATLKTALDTVLADANVLLTQINNQMKIEGAVLEEAQEEVFNALQAVVDLPNNVEEVPVVSGESSLVEVQSAIDEIESAINAVASRKNIIDTAIENVRNIYVDEASLRGYNLVLKGTIGLNFIMQLDSEKVDELINAKAYMNFTLGDKELATVKLSKDLLDETKGNNMYVFECGVPVKDMDKKIGAQLIIPDSERKGIKITYSVNDYIKYSVDSEETAHINARGLVKAMSNFGDYAAAYFKNDDINNTIDFITSIKPEGAEQRIREELAGAMSSATDNLTTILNGNNKASITGDSSIYSASSLLLKSGTVLRHYFNTPISVKGEPVKNQKGNYYYIELEGIAADKLGTDISMTVEVNNKSTTITCSPLHYAYIVLNNLKDEDKKELKDLMRAMVVYYQAADNYLHPSDTQE